VPTALADGVMAPVVELIERPAGALVKTPPVVPVMVALTAVVVNLHSGLYG
jgi:hypothetical protein